MFVKSLFKNWILYPCLSVTFGFGIFELVDRLYEVRSNVPSNTAQGITSSSVILCLGGGRGRIDQAMRLWLSFRGSERPYLYLAGLNSKMSLARLLRLAPLEVQQDPLWADPGTRVILENESQNTVSNAEYFMAFLKTVPHVDTIILVTSSYHLKRASFIFQSFLKQASSPKTLYVYPVASYPYQSKAWMTTFSGLKVTFSEFFKGIYYKIFWRPPASSQA